MRVGANDYDFLICPVRNLTPEQKEQIGKRVSDLEDRGTQIYWPPRDTNQDDPIGLRICQDNRSAIANAKKIRVFWDPSSQGSLFDLGMAFGMGKEIILENPESVQPTPQKSFNNVLLALNNQNAAKIAALTL